jgi:tRNA-binding EMAP/Myf-like protein
MAVNKSCVSNKLKVQIFKLASSSGVQYIQELSLQQQVVVICCNLSPSRMRGSSE